MIKKEVLPKVEREPLQAGVLLKGIGNKPQVFILNLANLNINLKFFQFHMPDFGKFIQQFFFIRFECLDIGFDSDTQMGDLAVGADNSVQLGQLVDALNVDLLLSQFVAEFRR